MDRRAAIPPGLPRSRDLLNSPNHPTASYWQDPPDKIADLRTTKLLPASAEYVIIGSGISGTCIAYNILRRMPNSRVVMIEAREACSGATGRNGGHTKAASYRSFPSHVRSHGVEEACKISRLQHANIVATHELAKELDILCESRSIDTVDIVYDQHTFQFGVFAIEMMRKSMGPNEAGAAGYTIFNSEEAAERFLAPGAIGAFQYAAGSISAYKFTIGLLKVCLSIGLHLHTKTAVDSIKQGRLPSATGDFRYEISTSEGPIMTNIVILATNGYTAHLLPQMQGKIVPMRGQVTAQRPGPKLKQLKANGLENTYSFIYGTGYEYMIPRPKLPSVPTDDVGDIIIGGGFGKLPNDGLSEYGNTDDTEVNPENSRYLKQTLKSYFGENWGDDDANRRVKKDWTGIMGITGDGVPFVGEVPGMQGCWISAGFNGSGMVQCLKSAEALTHMLFNDAASTYDWFPESFKITEKRLNEIVFDGRRNMKAPAELALATDG